MINEHRKQVSRVPWGSGRSTNIINSVKTSGASRHPAHLDYGWVGIALESPDSPHPALRGG